MFERTRVVLGDRNICDFRGVDFLLLTPSFLTLKQQTINRLAKSELVPPGEEVSRVLMYTESKNHTELFEGFKKRASTDKNTLFVMIADECHTSATLGGPHSKYINDEDLHNRRNFVLLGVRYEACRGLTLPKCLRFAPSYRATVFNILGEFKPQHVWNAENGHTLPKLETLLAVSPFGGH